MPSAILDGSEVTAIRTAACSGVATRLLAREDASDLALLGSGVQARTHLEAMRAVLVPEEPPMATSIPSDAATNRSWPGDQDLE